MRKLITVGLVLVAVGALVFVLAAPLQAQRDRPFVDVQALVSGGSRVGVVVRNVTADDLARAGLDETGGVVVTAVTLDSPAARAGLQAGDVIVEFDGERVRSVRQFTRLVQDTPAGRTVAATVMRDGARQSIGVAPEAARPSIDLVTPEIRRDIARGLSGFPRTFDDLDFDIMGGLFFSSRIRLGVRVAPLSDQLASYFGVDRGALVSEVEDGSAAAAAGIRAGDVITVIHGRTIENTSDVRQALADADAATVEIAIVRDRETITLTVRLPERAAPGSPAI